MRTSPRKFLIGAMACGILMLCNLLTVRKHKPRELKRLSSKWTEDQFFADTPIYPGEPREDIELLLPDDINDDLSDVKKDTIDALKELETEDDILLVEDDPPAEDLELPGDDVEPAADIFRKPALHFMGEGDKENVLEPSLQAKPEVPKVHWIRPIPDAERDHWRAIRTGNDSLYVFSAFYDPLCEDNPIVRVIAIGRRDSEEDEVVCHLSYRFKQGSRTMRTMGKVKIIEGSNLTTKFVAKWIHCSLTEEWMYHVPDRVRIIVPYFQEHYLLVHYKKQKSFEEVGINICIPSFTDDTGDVPEMVEFMEMHKIMGAMHFTIYRGPVTNSIGRLLINYKKEGFVTVFENNLPEEVDAENMGEVALVQDCFLRSRGVFQYVMPVDRGEYVVSEKYETMRGMLRDIDMSINSGFQFQSQIFCLNQPNNRTVEKFLHVMKRAFSIHSNGPFELNTMLKTMQIGECEPEYKGRVLMKPWAIDEASLHTITHSRVGFGAVKIPPHMANVRSYQHCPPGMFHIPGPCREIARQKQDTHLRNYLQRLSKRMLHRMQKINKAIIRRPKESKQKNKNEELQQ